MEKLIRPFPWKCSTCREKAMFPVVVNYDTEVGLDGRCYAISIPNLEVIECEKCHNRMLLDEANSRITEALREYLGLLAPNSIEERRTNLGLTQEQLADALQVEAYEVAAWESGGQIQSRATNRQLLAFFNVPAVRDYYRNLDGKARPEGASGCNGPQKLDSRISYC